MKIHEYQAKEILRKYGVATPRSIACFSVDEAMAAADTLGGKVWVVKAQIHAGGRGKGGGVKLARSVDESIEPTTVSAVIFLVSAQYEWATTYIINRVVNGDYGVAIAYSSVLIVLMAVVIALIQWAVGERRLGRRATGATGMGSLGAGAA